MVILWWACTHGFHFIFLSKLTHLSCLIISRFTLKPLYDFTKKNHLSSHLNCSLLCCSRWSLHLLESVSKNSEAETWRQSLQPKGIHFPFEKSDCSVHKIVKAAVRGVGPAVWFMRLTPAYCILENQLSHLHCNNKRFSKTQYVVKSTTDWQAKLILCKSRAAEWFNFQSSTYGPLD